ncbi:hypothetical protein Tco_0726744 [Tanacetum coccineum]|uniref:Reverse transcriptase domain-containing protein n=1 Tax=Tanacetum coccineum TaxID=301880 RepID=A0ABQ4YJD4_9ASTR
MTILSYGEDNENVDASPPDVEIVSLEVVEIVVPEVEWIDDDILLTIEDDIHPFYVDNDHFKEKSSGSTTTHVDFSRYDSFIFDLSNDQFPPADRSDLYHEDFLPMNSLTSCLFRILNVSNLRLSPILED